jgi:hypothetical protein
MAVVILTTGFILALSLVLFTVGHLRPRKFKIKAALTKWASLDLEMEAPEPSGRPWTTARPKVRSLLHQNPEGNERRPSTAINRHQPPSSCCQVNDVNRT